jgi:hypothetical protein
MHTRLCIVLQGIKKLRLRIILGGGMGLWSGMSFLFVLYRIGRWI